MLLRTNMIRAIAESTFWDFENCIVEIVRGIGLFQNVGMNCCNVKICSGRDQSKCWSPNVLTLIEHYNERLRIWSPKIKQSSSHLHPKINVIRDLFDHCYIKVVDIIFTMKLLVDAKGKISKFAWLTEAWCVSREKPQWFISGNTEGIITVYPVDVNIDRMIIEKLIITEVVIFSLIGAMKSINSLRGYFDCIRFQPNIEIIRTIQLLSV